MLRNYFKIALRTLARNKAFSFINIFGLAAGLATCLLIMLYVFDEISYDKHHKDADRIYRVAIGTEGIASWAATPAPVAGALKTDFPEVEQSTRLLTFQDMNKMLLKVIQNGDQRKFYETNGYYVDSNFFQLFSYDFKYGNALTALQRPNSLVISEEIAGKLFGTEDPIGKTVTVGNPSFGESDFTVAAVFRDTKTKSHIPAHFFLSMRSKGVGQWVDNQTNWASNNMFYTYIKFREGVDQTVFAQKLPRFLERRGGADLKAMGTVSKAFYLQPVRDIYLYSNLDNELAANGNIRYLYILSSIGVFILLIACINFMNLSTARSADRAKEVGVRKVMGAERGSLVRQFLGESFILCLMSLSLALLMAVLLLPYFNSVTGKNMQLFQEPKLVFWMIGLTAFTGLLSGLYPALYLSAFKPISVLKGKLLNNFSAALIRKGLVVFQFSISICLVAGAIVIFKQLEFLKNKNLGFNKDQQIILPLQNADAAKNSTALKDELQKNPQVQKVTNGSSYPGIPNIYDMLLYAEGKTAKDFVDVGLSAVGNDYIETLGFKVLYGRAFTKEFTGDSNSVVLNETAVRNLGYKPASAIGRQVFFDLQNAHYIMRIVGVVKDFHFESLHNEIKPFGFTTGLFANKNAYIIASVKTNDYAGLLTVIRKTWDKINPNSPFEYSFLDQDFQKNYEKEQLTSRIIGYFTVIAILIACLGLFGLSAFSAEQRAKEIGIRKVLGASVINLMGLLSRDFIGLVLIAIGIASPVAWYAMTKWLENFSYKISISWGMFASAGLLAVLIAVITVSFQAIKAAFANPVRSLRSE